MKQIAYIVLFVIAGVLSAVATLLLRDFPELAETRRLLITNAGEYRIPIDRWEEARLWDVAECPKGEDVGVASDCIDLGNDFEVQPEPVAGFADLSPYAQLTATTGRVQFQLIDESGEEVIVPCSAMFISKTVLLTAAHCLEAGHERRHGTIVKAAVRVGHVSDDGVLLDLSKKELDKDIDLDFALFELSPNNGEAEDERARTARSHIIPAVLSPRSLLKKEDLLVLGYPNAGAAHVIRYDCRVQSESLAGKRTRMSHSCGTAPGVSGSPIFAYENGGYAAVAMHQQAPRVTGAEPDSTGYGTSIRAIVNHSRVACELLKGNWRPASVSQQSSACELSDG